MYFNFSEMSAGQVYYKMIETIAPRPIAWVLSRNNDESLNLAPFSYFNGVCSNPPILSLSIGKKKDGSLKDTRRNIDEREEFVINIPHIEQAQDVTDSAKPLAENESEIDLLNLETVDCEGFPVPRLKDTRIAFLCKKHQIVEVGQTPQALILAEILGVYVDDKFVNMDERQTVDTVAVNSLARLGGNDYCSIGQSMTVKPSP